MLFSLDPPVTKNQIINTKWQLKFVIVVSFWKEKRTAWPTIWFFVMAHPMKKSLDTWQWVEITCYCHYIGQWLKPNNKHQMSNKVLCCLFNLKKEEASLAQDLVFSKRSIQWKGHLILDKGLKVLVSLDRTVTKNKIINPGNKTVSQSSLLCFQFEKQRGQSGQAFSF